MKSFSAFDRPKESLAWAREAIFELEVEFRNFFEPKPIGPIVSGKKVYGRVVDFDPETRKYVHKFKLFERLPRRLSRRGTEALFNTREAFNQSLYAACSVIGKVPRKGNLHFPWSTGPKDMRAKLENGPIPSEFWDVLAGEEPYPTGDGYSGGDDTTREIAKLANAKHTVGLSVTAHVSSVQLTNVVLVDGAVPVPLWDPVKDEIVLATGAADTSLGDNYNIQLQVVLDVTGPLRNIPATTLLCEFADRAEVFNERIEAVCAAVKGEKH